VPTASVAHIDIAPSEFGRHYAVRLAVYADARLALAALLERLPEKKRSPWVSQPAKREPWKLAGMDLCAAIRRALPRDAIVVADVTQLAYRMLVAFPVYEPRSFLHPAGGVSMGYGIPAALGAKAARPDRPGIASVGDGCFQRNGMEVAAALQ